MGRKIRFLVIFLFMNFLAHVDGDPCTFVKCQNFINPPPLPNPKQDSSWNWNYSQQLFKCKTHPSLNISITRSFSTLLLSPVNFSMPGTVSNSTSAEIRLSSVFRKAAKYDKNVSKINKLIAIIPTRSVIFLVVQKIWHLTNLQSTKAGMRKIKWEWTLLQIKV